MITATARDAAGNTATSTGVNVTVNNAAPAPTPPPTPAPVGGLTLGLNLNEGTGTAVTDSSGSGNNGTVAGATWSTSGKYGKALSFDGVDDKVSLGTAFNVVLPFTVEAWVYPTSYADWRAIFSKRDTPTANDTRFDIGLSSGSGLVYVYTAVSQLTSSYKPPLNAWTHLAAVVSSTGAVNLYANGVPQASLGTLTLGNDTSAKVSIGNTGDNDDPFAGRLDDIRVYSKALTQAEVQADMNTPVEGAAVPPAAPANLVPNGNMEGALWTNSVAQGTPSISLTTAQKVSGTKSVTVTNGSTPLYVAVLNSGEFAVTGGKKYTASLMAKTEGVNDKGVWLLVRWYNASGALISTATMDSVTGTTDWVQKGKTVTAPSAAVKAVAEVRVRAKTGTAYIDDVTCTLMP